MKKNIAVIGCGYWGPKLVRNFYASDQWFLKYVCDQNGDQLQQIRENYPAVETTEDCKKLWADDTLEAVAIATPVSTHYELARQSLEAGKHTWVEKPLAFTSREAEELVELADRKKLILHVDHTFIYTPAVRKIKEVIDQGTLGEIYYFDSTRVNLGLFQHDINVIWDLAPHDISILRFLISKNPSSVNATAKCHIKLDNRQLENIGYITVHFDDDSIAHFHVNWLSPVKIRQILIGGSRKMLVYNDLETMEKIKVYDTGVETKTSEEAYRALVQYRTGDMHSPRVENWEALRLECRHFHEAVTQGRPTDTNGRDGLYVVRILEAATESIKKDGALIRLARS